MNKKAFDIFDNESIYNYILHESSITTNMIFLSPSNMNGHSLSPRIPSNYFTKNGFENDKTGRVCFAPNIDKALMALSYRCKGLELYVHEPLEINKSKIKHPSHSDVPDVNITGEIWYLDKIKLKCIGKIKVIDDKGNDGLKYKYGNNEAYLYEWDWKWIEKY